MLTLTMLSSPPDTTHRPSGLNLIAFTPRVCPLYVWMQPFRRMSQILRFVSSEPEAKNSPNGWKSTDIQLERWPVKVLTTANALQEGLSLRTLAISYAFFSNKPENVAQWRAYFSLLQDPIAWWFHLPLPLQPKPRQYRRWHIPQH